MINNLIIYVLFDDQLTDDDQLFDDQLPDE